MSTEILLLLTVILGFAGIGALIIFLSKKQQNPYSDEQLENVVAKTFGLTSNQLAEQSRRILQGEKEVIQTDLVNKQKSIQDLVENLKKDLQDRQRELRTIEKDRTSILSAMKESIELHQETTKQLHTTTENLSRVLSNNQQRGEWGEQIIEDLLQSSGLVEGIHYQTQAKLGTTTDRPDITLLLPNQRVVPVDVKFPYAAMYKLVQAQTKAERVIHSKQFAQDIKNKIKKVSLYIQPEQDTLDYAILFVPNEMVFSYINQNYPELVAEAMRARVMIVSPFTFLIVARTIMESYRNFMMESNLRTIVKQIGEFAKQWEMFIEEFDKFGDSIGKMENAYKKIRETRHTQMSRRIEKIEEYKLQESTVMKLEE